MRQHNNEAMKPRRRAVLLTLWAILAHGAVSRVLIIGGGDGGMLRGGLRHPGTRSLPP